MCYQIKAGFIYDMMGNYYMHNAIGRLWLGTNHGTYILLHFGRLIFRATDIEGIEVWVDGRRVEARYHLNE